MSAYLILVKCLVRNLGSHIPELWILVKSDSLNCHNSAWIVQNV